MHPSALSFLCAGLFMAAASCLAGEPSAFTGRWIEQADDPLKITLVPGQANHVDAHITHGFSDEGTTLQLQRSGDELLHADGTPAFRLEHGKLRQLGAGRLVLFVRLQ